MIFWVYISTIIQHLISLFGHCLILRVNIDEYLFCINYSSFFYIKEGRWPYME